jgi:hypothetical protein
MEIIKTFADRVVPGSPVGSHALCMVPLVRTAASGLRYQTLQAALAAGTLRITEVSDGGSVPEVRVHNDGDLPVLLLEGAALVGAKQNRVLNLSVLVAGHSKTLVPVSCVEQGRWSARSAEFAEGNAMHFAAGRARKVRDVSASLETFGAPRSDQGAVWSDMAYYKAGFAAHAPSDAMQDIYESAASRVEPLLARLEPVAGQVGAAFFSRGRLLGLDAFDASGTMSVEFPKIVRSYAVDAVRGWGDGDESEPGGAGELDSVRRLLADLAAGEWQAYPGVGLGTDLRLTTSRLAAGALVHDDEVVHLAAFPGLVGESRDDLRHAPAMPRYLRSRLV